MRHRHGFSHLPTHHSQHEPQQGTTPRILPHRLPGHPHLLHPPRPSVVGRDHAVLVCPAPVWEGVWEGEGEGGELGAFGFVRVCFVCGRFCVICRLKKTIVFIEYAMHEFHQPRSSPTL